MSQKELQQKMLEYQFLEEKFKELQQSRELFTMKIMEINQSSEALEEIEKSKQDDVFLPLGSSIFVPGKIDKKEKMIVGVGADIAVEKNIGEIKELLEKRKKTLENGLESVQNNMLEIANQIRVLEPKIQEMLSKTE